jgi:FAD/FMN-containing dehydrogenase
MSAVTFAREQGLEIAIRGGGHNVAGNAVCDDGLVIDLSQMRSVQVDPARRVARVEGGCVWKDVDHATHAFGLATPGGIISSTGVAGLTLGGGIGYLNRQYGLYSYWKADFIRVLTLEAIGEHVSYGADLSNVLSAMHFYPLNGAVQRIPRDATAFAYRDVAFCHVIACDTDNPADMQQGIQWVRNYWSAAHPYSAGGAYMNFLMEEGADRVQAAFGENYARLGEVKTAYDPNNLFHYNQNIQPRSQ